MPRKHHPFLFSSPSRRVLPLRPRKSERHPLVRTRRGDRQFRGGSVYRRGRVWEGVQDGGGGRYAVGGEAIQTHLRQQRDGLRARSKGDRENEGSQK